MQKSILIADQQAEVCHMLAGLGVDCQQVESMDGAHLNAAFRKRYFDALIVVVRDNFLKEIHAIEAFCQSENYVELPIVLIDKSTFPIPNNIRLAFQSGVTEYISGDANELEVISRIEHQIERNKHVRELTEENIASLETISLMDRLILFMDKADSSFIIYDEHGEIEWANAGFSRMYGCTIDEYKRRFGKTIYESTRHIDLEAKIKQCVKQRKTFDYTSYSQTRSGNYKWIQTTFTPVFTASGKIDRFIAIETDITKQKEAEEALSNKNEYMAALTDNLIQTNRELEEKKALIQEKNLAIEAEQLKSEELLHNILPKEVGRQLKSKGQARPKNYKLTTVMFLDFVKFSNLAQELHPKELVTVLDSYFKIFDDIIDKHHIEKIKTIGDAYMCVGGLPLSNKSNPFDMVVAALEMQEAVNQLLETHRTASGLDWNCRIGIHTGSVIAGVVGKKKYMYDIWGDTVNVAARMQQEGEVGRLNISGATYAHIQGYFDCDYRGKIAVKNADKIDMYFVNGILPAYAHAETPYIPNEELKKYVNTL